MDEHMFIDLNHSMKIKLIDDNISFYIFFTILPTIQLCYLIKLTKS